MRKLRNWISAYMEYMEETESNRKCHLWTAMSAIAASLRKKIHLKLGRINIYSNMYVILVGPPGGPRKSQAISFGIKFLSNIPDVTLSADATSPRALLDDLETCAVDEQMPDGTMLRHSSLTVTSKEFESFLGAKKENAKMITYLTDLFDAQETPWKYRTKHVGDNVVPSVFLNILAATTPDSIAKTLPSAAIGGGLTSRVMFVWVDKKYKKVCYPEESKEAKVLKDYLKHDLYIISRLSGEYTFSKECRILFKKWYDNYEASSPDRICKDESFTGWYERKPLYILKLAMIHAASESNSLELQWNHFLQSINKIEDAEKNMPYVFKAVGRSPIVADVDLVIEIIRNRKWIREKALLSLVWRDIDSNKLDNVLDTVIRSGKVKRSYIGPKGEKGDIWYCAIK